MHSPTCYVSLSVARDSKSGMFNILAPIFNLILSAFEQEEHASFVIEKATPESREAFAPTEIAAELFKQAQRTRWA